MSLKFCRSTMTCQQKGIQLLKFIVLLLALVETFTDSVIDCIIYTVDFNANSPTSASILHYCIGAYYLPNKRFYKVIIVLYVPALCLWRVRSRSSGHPSVQQAPNDGDEYNASLLKTPLRPAALVSHVALYIRNVPGNAWLQRILNSYMPGWKISKQQIDEFYLSEDNNGDELILSSEIWNHQSKFFNEESVQTRFLSWTEQHRQEHNSTIVLFIKKLPTRLVSRLYGRIHRCILPIWVRLVVLRFYIWVFNCNLAEAAVQDLKRYRNLSEFFLRSLRKGIRPINRSCRLTSPVDGTVVYCGPVVGNCLEQVKGVTYSLSGFLGPLDTFLASAVGNRKSDISVEYNDLICCHDLISKPGNCLYQCVIYLSPGDYHHFHSPSDWSVLARRHFPDLISNQTVFNFLYVWLSGELCSVSPSFTRLIQGVFNFNERAVYFGRWQHGFFSMTAVGATLVGSINVYLDKALSTNTASTGQSGSFYDKSFSQLPKYRLRKGQSMGDFRLGSTIVLLFEAPVGFQFSISTGQKVKYGMGISVDNL